ncbi:type III pantothenate kinase [Candidatus Anaplasma sp. TIGMIC]|uniref:type III pantothenate kinase n=1 Tax=Candidatus Anaplasma sp. TIGMIC TaxID=3020713 RepID=UPI00232AF07B|nr:type III pantothenate kinase [Candidatus Anaplasma sp. TIGMIC]MDB1135364.1 type III pantothenate kinase [Candidatus Anaplasma sp. TIGMIC]
MIAVVDVGNTNIKFAISADGEFTQCWRISVSYDRTAAELYAILQVLVEGTGIDLRKLKGAAVSSVVPSVNNSIRELFESFLGVTPVFVTCAHSLVLDLGVHFEQKFIGSDRFADLVAARTSWPNQNLLVIDMGTITVFNLLNKEGSLYGQVLAPGLSCMTKSMSLGAALLPQVNVRGTPSKVVAGDLLSAIESGLYWGYVSMVEGTIARIVGEEKDKSLKVVATGGGSVFVKSCPHVYAVDELLTLKGILHIYTKLQMLH